METHSTLFRLDVPLGDRSYPILVGRGVLQHVGEHLRALQPSQLAILTHPQLAQWYGEPIVASLQQAGIPTHLLPVPPGERTKRWEVVGRLLRQMAQRALDRRCVVVALGGGVIGDLAGFVAACYLRGVRYVQIPTTLLAQVDSSVGGKTGVNLPEGKNLVGAFHQPVLVLIDTDTLATLPRRHFRAGLAEVLKYGLIADEALWHLVRAEASSLRQGQSERLEEIVYRCCAIKARIVSEDETEQGVRAILNFGHTVGHALEAVEGYGRLLHGEAVAIGMVSAALVGEVVGVTPAGTAEEIARSLQALGLPVTLPQGVDFARLLQVMARDKKARDGQVRFVLLERVGQARLPVAVNEEAVIRALSLHQQKFVQRTTGG
ncbi:MAG: 3-dehydroquinate synthase [Armatimonadota bacterium]|nr:3-dehydroquinate synthase [bacterium]MCS7308689.1 3-dehydroquinate synthase [Armatimonadota bacterium]MDW8104411.1 3-dehydroquinate synthase [Armatimonadota bacterium]MDW8289184.1 3-dehydroquinate synthase [Armatimonadota bacterium]